MNLQNTKKIDLHIHVCSFNRISEFLQYCGRAEISQAGLISLPDTKRGTFNRAVITAARTAPERFKPFGCLNYNLGRSEADGANQVKSLKADGFFGLKLWIGKPEAAKIFKVKLEDDFITGALKAASDLAMPVLIHLADSPDFWEKDDAGISVYSHSDGTFEEWIERGRNLFTRFPDISFIGAHMLFLAGGLGRLENVLFEHRNLKIDTAPGRWFFRPLAEKKEESRQFIKKWSGKILLGSDSMFFPKDYELFKAIGLNQNLRTVKRIVDFLSASKKIKDPYKTSNLPLAKKQELDCLGLEKPEIERIFYKNAEELFRS